MILLSYNLVLRSTSSQTSSILLPIISPFLIMSTLLMANCSAFPLNVLPFTVVTPLVFVKFSFFYSSATSPSTHPVLIVSLLSLISSFTWMSLSFIFLIILYFSSFHLSLTSHTNNTFSFLNSSHFTIILFFILTIWVVLIFIIQSFLITI